jgi:hypothetical protein
MVGISDVSVANPRLNFEKGLKHWSQFCWRHDYQHNDMDNIRFNCDNQHNDNQYNTPEPNDSNQLGVSLR